VQVIYGLMLIIPLIIFVLFIWRRLARLSLPLLETVWVPKLLKTGEVKQLIFTVVTGLLIVGVSEVSEGPAGS
jgi:hypothetical protein